MKFFDRESYSLPVVLAVGLHVVVLLGGVILAGVTKTDPEPPKRPPIVNAKIVDVSDTIIGKREAEQRKAAQAAAQAKEAAQRKADEQAKRQAELEQQRRQAQAVKERQEQARQKAEAARQAALEKQKAEEQARQQQRAKEKKAAQEKARKEREAREKEAAAEKARREAERKRQQELERQRAAEAEAARKAEAQAAERRRRAEEAVKQAMAEEERRLQEQQEGQMVQSISSLINNRITAAWIRPPGARNGMQTLLRINFLPSGEVNNVQVIESSGDAIFDQKAKDAVYRVGRIEELSEIESYIFERNFRRIDLLFNPQDLRN